MNPDGPSEFTIFITIVVIIIVIAIITFCL
jgi:hypothetical protein